MSKRTLARISKEIVEELSTSKKQSPPIMEDNNQQHLLEFEWCGLTSIHLDLSKAAYDV